VNKLDVKAKTVTVAENTTLESAEIMLAATDSVELKAGAQVVASGAAPVADSAPVLAVKGDGALLRVSTGVQAQIDRTGTSGQQGELLISDNAKVVAETGSVLLDSTHNLTMKGVLQAGESLNIGADSINIGEIDRSISSTGLSLDNAQLSQFAMNELVLTSRGNVNIFGKVLRTDADGKPVLDDNNQTQAIAFKNLVISAQGIAGFANAGKTAALAADTLTLKNQGSTGQGPNGDGTGLLAIKASNLALAGGDFTLSGFSSLQINLDKAFTGIGTSTLTALGNLSIDAAYLTGATGADTTLDATGYELSLTSTKTLADASHTGIAAQLNLKANALVVDAPLYFNAGRVSAQAVTGDVTLKDKAVIDVSGAVVQAGLSEPAALSAGSIALTALQHDVNALAGSQLLLNGATASSAGGHLAVTAVQGLAHLNGTIAAHGGGSAAGGQVAVDESSLGANGFGSLNTLFSQAGFTDSIKLRIRNGDLTVGVADKVLAQTVDLTADSGSLTVLGTIDAQAKNGGTISLNADGLLTVAAGAKLLAKATTDLGDGGKVTLNSIAGGGIALQNGALVDVSAKGGQDGDVHLRSNRLADTVNIAPIAAGTIVGDAQVTLEAVANYQLNTLNASALTTIKNDTANFMAAVSARLTPSLGWVMK
jgi:hypothetical protein